MDREFTFKLNTAFGGDFPKEVGASKSSFNFKTDGVSLTDGISLAYAEFGEDGISFTFPEDFELNTHFCCNTVNGEKLILVGKGLAGEPLTYVGNCASPQDGFTLVEGLDFNEGFSCANAIYSDNAVAIIANEGGVAYCYDGISFQQFNSPTGIKRLAYFDGKLVAVTEGVLYLSATNNPTDFYNEGNVTFNMPYNFLARSSVVFGEELIVGGVHGIMRITKNNFTGEYVMRTVAGGGERFYPQTLAVGSDGVCFLAERGLGVYDGAGVSYYFNEISGLVQEGINGFVYGRDYFAQVKTPQNTQKQMFLVFNGGNWYASDMYVDTISLRADGINYLATVKGRKKAYSLSGSFSTPMPIRRYETADTDFGLYGKKTLKALSAYTQKDVKIVITTDGRRRAFRLRGGKGRRIILPYITGEVFSFKIIFDGHGSEISKITAVVSGRE